MWLRFAQDANSVATQAPASLNDFVDAVERVQEGNGLKEIKCALAEPVFGKLEPELAAALMGINAVKGVEFGAGFDAVRQRGSEHRDERDRRGFLSNNAGGVLGGISSGQDIVASIALKPTSSIVKPGRGGEARRLRRGTVA